MIHRMRRLSHGTLLAVANAGLVLLTLATIAVPGALLVQRLVVEQARQRAAGAAATAAREVAAAAERLEVSARLLADSPSLQRMQATGRRRELAAFFERFCRTSGLTGAALLRGGQEWARTDQPPPAPPPEPEPAAPSVPEPSALGGAPAAAPEAGPVARPPANETEAASGEGAAPAPTPAPISAPPPAGVRWIAVPTEGPLVLAARVAIEQGEDAQVVVWLRLDEAFAARLTRQVGVPVHVVPPAAAASPAAPPSTSLASLGRAVAPLPTELGGAGVVEAALPEEELLAPLRRLLGGYALGACLAAGLAVAVGLLLGRRFGAPARALARSASRIGGGDLQTPVPVTWAGEMGQLGLTLEEMRRRLQELTAELARQEAEARAVLGGIVEGVLAVDEDRRVTYLNPGAAALLQIDAEQAKGKFCGELLRPEAEGGTLPCAERCPIVHARGLGTAQALERLRPAGGPARAVMVSSSAPAAGSQVLVLRDETEQEAGRRVREAILANLSHELKTPLAAQLASVELLRDGLAAAIPAGEARDLVAALERSTLRLMGLVDNLLTSSRLEAGEWGMRAEDVDLREVAEEAAALLLPLFAQRRQHLDWELAELPVVRGDHTQLLQVVLNLLGNANKFAPEGSTVRVGGGNGEGGVALWVEDEGPGLPPGSEAALFERFRRAPGAAQRGVGLGLWVVRAVVERHGGTVAAGRGRLGGARFTVTLPRPEASAA